MHFRILTVAVVLIANLGFVHGSCGSHGKTDGCSIPGDLPYFYDDVFKPDCDKHDVCYACGQHFGVSRSNCDGAFYQDIKLRCEHDSRVHVEPWCKAVTFDYYAAVRIGGSSHYEDPAFSWCSQSWVRSCIGV